MGHSGAPLEMRCISKSFYGVPVLWEVDLDCRAGEIHAIVGENGAGKSTLMKILAGAYQPDAGTIRLEGQEVHFSHPGEAKEHGVSLIYQEFTLLPDRTVAQNIFLESFSAGNQSLARAASIWRPLERSQDAIATDGLAFLKDLMARRPERSATPR